VTPEEQRAMQLRDAFNAGIRETYRRYVTDPQCAREFADGASAAADDLAGQ
jgi:hypothetical protein